MSAQPQSIAGRVFKTKKALQDEIKRILHDSPLDERLEGNDYELVRALLDRHPSAEIKVGSGVRAIRVVNFQPYKNRGFELERVDGSRTDFSYLRCLNPETKLAKLKRACRFAVSPDIIAFRNAFFGRGQAAYEVSGRFVTVETCHVDHAPPMTFKVIFEAFMQEYGVNIDKIALSGCDVDGSTTYDIEHPAIKSLWVNFHNKHASLRILHVDTHKEVTRGTV
jgi:hypothetical protein